MADVEKIKKQIKQLEARVKQVEALEKTKKRKEDTRRKIILGGALLAAAARDPKWEENFYARIDDLVTNRKDRALIGLDMPQEQPPSVAAAVSAVAPKTVDPGHFKIKEDTPL